MSQAVANLNSRTASRATFIKLVVFSICLGLGPVSAYFGSLKFIWNGNATYAAITAIVTANLVLVAYIIASVREDQQGAAAPPATETKKHK